MTECSTHCCTVLLELLFVDLDRRYNFIQRFDITATEFLHAVFGDYRGASRLSGSQKEAGYVPPSGGA